jgi:hypothetical protein
VARDFPNYREIVKALFNIQSGPGMEVFRGLSIPPEKYPGMPIRTVVEVLGQKITTTVDSVEETNLADSDFAIPTDYKELNPASLQDKDKTEGHSQ